MKNLSKTLLPLLAIVMLAACQRDKAEWDVGIVAPIAKSTLTIEDLIPGSYVVANTDSSLRIVYQNTIYTLPVDSFLQLPDTTIYYPLTAPTNFNLSAGFNIPFPSSTINFLIDPAKLTRVVINQGQLKMRVVNRLPREIMFDYAINKAIKNGLPFSASELLTAANPDSAVVDKEYDLSGYDIALNGTGMQTNILPYNITAGLAQNSQNISVTTGQLLLKLYTTFTNMKPEYVEGYFGNQAISYGPEVVDFDFLEQIVGGTLDLDDINLGISFENAIGADIRATIKSLKGINTNTGNSVTLQHPIINMPVNIDRAVNLGYNNSPQFAPVTKSYPFTNATSNLAAFVSNLPNQLEYKVDLKVNPLGNISGGYDFLYRDAGIKINLDLDMPLTFKAGGLTLVDTIDYNLNAKPEDVSRYQGGNFKLYALNGFPLDATVQLYLVDENGAVTDSLFSTSLIAAAPVDANFKAIGQQATQINFAVSIDKADALVNTKKVLIKAKFTTQPQSQLLKMYSNYKLDLQLTSDFKFRMKL